MAVLLLDRPISSLQPSNIMSPRFGPVRFYPQPRLTERHRTFTLCIRHYSGAILGLLLPSQRTAGRVGARRLQLAIIPRAWACSIRPSMFRPMVRPSRLSFTTIEITPALTCWLIFTWHNHLMVALPGNPTSGLLLCQPMLRSLRSPPPDTCSVIILGLHILRGQLCRQYRYGWILEPAIPIRLLRARGLRLMPTWLRDGKPR